MEHSRIPNSLKRYRRLAGLTQKEVASILGLKKTSCISRWEKGLSFPSIKHVFQLSLLYKTQPDNLYDELWSRLNEEIKRLERELLAQHELLIINEKYFL